MKLELPMEGEEALHLLDVQAVPFEGGFILRRGLTRVFLEAPQLEEILLQLVERAQTDEGASALNLLNSVNPSNRPVMEGVISALRQRRLLVTSAERSEAASNNTHEEVFYWSYGTSAAAVLEKIAHRRIVVMGYNHVGVAMVESLRTLGFDAVTLVDQPLLRNVALSAPGASLPVNYDEWSARDDVPDCIVVTCDFGGPDVLSEWNTFCVNNKVTFFAAVIHDHRGQVGPLVLPGESACYECAALRERAASADVGSLRATDGSAYFSQNTFGFLPTMAAAIANLAATELLKFYSQALPGCNVGRLIEYNMLVPEILNHRLLKLPRCPVCSPIVSAPTFTADAKIFMPGNE